MKKRKHLCIILIVFAVTIVINVLAWLGPHMPWNWCDFYVDNIFSLWVGTFGRLTGAVSFSIGEIMLMAAVALIIISLLFGIALIFLRKKQRVTSFAKKYYIVIAYIVSIVCFIMTMNCAILYHVTPVEANRSVKEREYSIDELLTLRNYVVSQCEYYSEKMPRDEDGYILYEKDIQLEARKAMIELSKKYPRLKGYYPRVKHLLMSDFMSQMYMCGYYFPFSLEANCNGNMYITNYPATYCHELSHLHGYIYEDEANFMAFMACIGSEDEFMVYCGWLSVLFYVDNAYWDSINGNYEEYAKQPMWNATVDTDTMFLPPKVWEEVENNAVISTDIVSDATDKFTETTLNLNGVLDGMASYGRVVELLLKYFDGDLY